MPILVNTMVIRCTYSYSVVFALLIVKRFAKTEHSIGVKIYTSAEHSGCFSYFSYDTSINAILMIVLRSDTLKCFSMKKKVEKAIIRVSVH